MSAERVELLAPPAILRAVKTRFIFNPRSGHNARNPHLLDRARSFITEHRLDATADTALLKLQKVILWLMSR